MSNYAYRSKNTNREFKTRIGAAFNEYFDYFRSDSFDIPKYFYPILIATAPAAILSMYWYSLFNNSPIEKIKKVNLNFWSMRPHLYIF